MKYTKILLVVLISIALMSCSKKDEKTTSDDKTKDTKKTEQTQPASFFKITATDKAEKNVAPNFTWEENGKKVSLADFKGKTVLINLWATWCMPCKKEIPDLKEIATELKDKNFKMIGVTVFPQQGATSLEDYLKTNPINYTILEGNDEFVKNMEVAIGSQIDGIPTTIIVNGDGKVVENFTGGRNKAGFMESINKYIK